MKEVEDRVAAYERGEIDAVDGDEAMAYLRRELHRPIEKQQHDRRLKP